MSDKEYLSSREISKYLDIPLRTIQRLTQCGKIKGIKVGKQWRFKKLDIENYLAFGADFSKEPVRKSNDFTERRAFPRINTDLDCQYLINLPRFKVINSKAIIKNLSAGGILAICQDDRIEIGDPINIEFMDIKTESRVVRKDKSELGIKFRNINEEGKAKIIKYIG